MRLAEATKRIEAAGFVVDQPPMLEDANAWEMTIARCPHGDSSPVFEEIRIGRASQGECLEAAVKIAEALQEGES